MAASTPKKPPLTHFLCIPLVTAVSRTQLSLRLAEFRDDITSPNSFAVPLGAVRPLGTLHLTLGVMSLKEDGKLEEATELLKGLKLGEILESVREAEREKRKTQQQLTVTAAVTDGVEVVASSSSSAVTGLTISLRGLQTMQKPAQATVLYAAPMDEAGLLYPFCERVRGVFREAGLVVDDGRALLLHATVVNTIYVKDNNNGNSSRGNRRGNGNGRGRRALALDARAILDRYEEFAWIDGHVVEGVAICKMGAKEVDGDDGQAYEVVAEVGF